MKNIIIKIIILLGISLNLQMRCTKPEVEIESSNQTKILKHNYIVVNSVDGSPCEVEMSYSVFIAGNAENIVKTEKLTTPFVIGGEEVKVVYDSLIFRNHIEKRHLHNVLKRNYAPKGSDFLSIKNLSNVDLEYSVIGNQSIQYHSVDVVNNYGISNVNQIDKTKVVQYSPTPIYKDTPVLYLIKPELAPQTDVYIRKFNPKIAEKISLKTPNFGEVVAHTPYSASQIIGLYKQEYSNGNTLYFSYYAQYIEKNSMNNGKNKMKHYDVIPAGQTLSNTGQVWFVNTHQGFYGHDIFQEYGE